MNRLASALESVGHGDKISASKVEAAAGHAYQLAKTKPRDATRAIVENVAKVSKDKRLSVLYVLDATLKKEAKKGLSGIADCLRKQDMFERCLSSLTEVSDTSKQQVTKVLSRWFEKKIFKASLVQKWLLAVGCAVSDKISSEAAVDPLEPPTSLQRSDLNRKRKSRWAEEGVMDAKQPAIDSEALHTILLNAQQALDKQKQSGSTSQDSAPPTLTMTHQSRGTSLVSPSNAASAAGQPQTRSAMQHTRRTEPAPDAAPENTAGGWGMFAMKSTSGTATNAAPTPTNSATAPHKKLEKLKPDYPSRDVPLHVDSGMGTGDGPRPAPSSGAFTDRPPSGYSTANGPPFNRGGLDRHPRALDHHGPPPRGYRGGPRGYNDEPGPRGYSRRPPSGYPPGGPAAGGPRGKLDGPPRGYADGRGNQGRPPRGCTDGPPPAGGPRSYQDRPPRGYTDGPPPAGRPRGYQGRPPRGYHDGPQPAGGPRSYQDRPPRGYTDGPPPAGGPRSYQDRPPRGYTDAPPPAGGPRGYQGRPPRGYRDAPPGRGYASRPPRGFQPHGPPRDFRDGPPQDFPADGPPPRSIPDK